ncbi:MAG: hypothetical protein CVV02_01700 [Firmicutes bacterium HGW-Firmicutes-7]|nr:MAG: hypothetical protein CVV02_01700 [Firmicutes bacterium HGW-Firmicutes-7]
MIKSENDLIDVLVKFTGIRRERIIDYSKETQLSNVVERPSSINPSREEEKAINYLRKVFVNYNIINDYLNDVETEAPFKDVYSNYFKNVLVTKKDREVFVVALLKKDNTLIKTVVICKGDINAALVPPRDVVRTALEYEAEKIICCHNHPSGVSVPSREDIALTMNIIDILRPLGIEITDHIIVGSNSYQSMAVDYPKLFEEINNVPTSNPAFDKLLMMHGKRLLYHISELTKVSLQKLESLTVKDNELPKVSLRRIIDIICNSSNYNGCDLSTTEKDLLENGIGKFINAQQLIRVVEEEAINSPSSAYEVFEKRFAKEKDKEVIIGLLDTKNKIIGIKKVERTLSPRDLLQSVLANNAVHILVIVKEQNDPNNRVLVDISQKLSNIFSPIRIELLDVIHCNEQSKTIISLKEKNQLMSKAENVACYEDIEFYGEDEKENGIEVEDDWELEV